MNLGIDRIVIKRFRPLDKARIGLCTNFSCCDSTLTPTITVFSRRFKASLRVIFAPEHGLYAALQDQVLAPGYYDRKKGIMISSLYGRGCRADMSLLREIDVLVIDLQDIGTRYYTYLWSAILLMQQAAVFEKRVLVLDRPNPLSGTVVQGPVLEPEYSSFVGLFSIPVRHGMTIGELCNLINEEYRLGAHIETIRMAGWRRRYYHTETELPWVMPSPNMPLFDTALVYPGLCLLEGTNISEGRGTTRPFELFGAPWIDPALLVRAINRRKIPGVDFRQAYFVPTFSKYRGKLCGGAQIYVKNRKRFSPFSTGLEIIKVVRTLYPNRFRWREPPYEFEKKKLPIDILNGNSWIRKAIEDNRSMSSIKNRWKQGLHRFMRTRNKYLLYA